MMTRNDFVILAYLVNSSEYRFANLGAMLGFSESLADELALTNDRFDRDKFISACMKGWERDD